MSVHSPGETCDEFMGRGPRMHEVCGRRARWRDPWQGNGLCSLHAASAVKSESLAYEDLEPIRDESYDSYR